MFVATGSRVLEAGKTEIKVSADPVSARGPHPCLVDGWLRVLSSRGKSGVERFLSSSEFLYFLSCLQPSARHRGSGWMGWGRGGVPRKERGGGRLGERELGVGEGETAVFVGKYLDESVGWT